LRGIPQWRDDDLITIEIFKSEIASLRPVHHAVQGYARNDLSAGFPANC
jgi:hypothetical protein